jgi:hypothetical protein
MFFMECQKIPNPLKGGGGKPRVFLIKAEIAGLPGKAAWFFLRNRRWEPAGIEQDARYR